MEIFIVNYSRMQTLDVIANSKRPSTVAVISTSISESGFRSLYTGLSASLMRQMSYSMVRLGVYEEMKSKLSKDGPPSNVDLLLAAAMAGALGGIAGNPAGTNHSMLFVQVNDLQHWLRYRIGPNDQRFHSTSGEAIWVPQRCCWCN